MPKKPSTRKTKPVAPNVPEIAPAPLPQRPPHAFTQAQWADNPALQTELQALLENPVMKMAFQTILMTAMPNASPVEQLIPGITAEQMALADSMRYRHRSGMSHTYRALHKLARAKSTPKKDAEWGQMLETDE